MKAPSPLLGFNNNFKHKGQVYHIQTEDSGVKHPHIITHLFADGGRILKSVKTSYQSVLGDPAMADIVRNMMKEQHKAMIVALRDGQFDPGGAKEVKLPTTGPFALATSAGPRPSTQQSAAAAPVEVVPAVMPPPAEPVTAPVDVNALERAAATASPRSPMFDVESDLPPPPPNVLGGSRESRRHGEYASVAPPNARRPSRPPPSSVDPATLRRPEPSSAPATGRRSAAVAPSAPPGASASQRPPAGRYALTRPASIFATSKPNQGSIFGEELISERSLDEVILSYLAEDLEGEKK